MSGSEFEVVKSNVDGWDVRRVGEAQPLTNHATREEAEEAARIQAEQEGPGGDQGQAIDVRQDVFSDDPDSDDVAPTRTAISFGVMAIAVIVLLAVVAAIVAITGFGI
jgi:hypothetical protein